MVPDVASGLCMYTSTETHAPTNPHTAPYIPIYRHTHTYTHPYTSLHTYTYLNTNTHMHIHAFTDPLKLNLIFFKESNAKCLL